MLGNSCLGLTGGRRLSMQVDKPIQAGRFRRRKQAGCWPWKRRRGPDGQDGQGKHSALRPQELLITQLQARNGFEFLYDSLPYQ